MLFVLICTLSVTRTQYVTHMLRFHHHTSTSFLSQLIPSSTNYLAVVPPCSMNYSFSFHPVIATRHTLTSLTCPSLHSRHVFISIHLFGPLHCCPPSQLYTIVTSSSASITSAHFTVVHLPKPHILPLPFKALISIHPFGPYHRCPPFLSSPQTSAHYPSHDLPH